MTEGRGLSHAQVENLMRPLARARVVQRKDTRNLNMQAYELRAHMNRVFGFGNWSGDVLDSWLIGEHRYTRPAGEKNGKTWPASERVTVVYRVRYRLTVCDPWGNLLASYTEEAVGDAQGFPFPGSWGDAHDFALKTAESQAFKRTAINLGDQFGLVLYSGVSLAEVERNGDQFPALVHTTIPYWEATRPAEQEAAEVTPARQVRPETDEGEEPIPTAELDWVAEAEARQGDPDSVMALWNEARKARVSTATLDAIRARAAVGRD